jgi:hypothetical protein
VQKDKVVTGRVLFYPVGCSYSFFFYKVKRRVLLRGCAALMPDRVCSCRTSVCDKDATPHGRHVGVDRPGSLVRFPLPLTDGLLSTLHASPVRALCKRCGGWEEWISCTEAEREIRKRQIFAFLSLSGMDVRQTVYARSDLYARGSRHVATSPPSCPVGRVGVLSTLMMWRRWTYGEGVAGRWQDGL